jgi:SAM-dependent methyltransferase
MNVVDYFSRPFRLDLLDRYFSQSSTLNILDIGCGNASPQATKKLHKNVRYYGINVSTENLCKLDIDQMERLFICDLNQSFPDIPQDIKFDIVIMSHIIEHLQDGYAVIKHITPNLKEDGILYIETPHPRSLKLPSMTGTLNFHDDPTHLRVYPPDEMIDELTKLGYQCVKSGTRYSIKRILLLPVYLVRAVFKGLDKGPIFWDVSGFAHYNISQKK